MFSTKGFNGPKRWAGMVVSAAFVALSLAAAVFPATASAVEAESGGVSGAARVVNNSAMSGGAGIGFIGGAANYVTLQISSSWMGYHTMTISYVSPTARTLYWSINGAQVGSASLNSGSSGSVGVHEVVVWLNAGANAVRFYNDGAVAPDLDQVAVRMNCPLNQSSSGGGSGGGRAYEAESGTLNGTARVVSKSFMSGGQGVSGLGSGASNWVSLNNVEGMSGAGAYDMLVMFSSADTRELSWSVNGGPGSSARLNSGASANVVGSYLVRGIAINAGLNTVRFYNGNGPAPDVDSIVVGRWSSFCGNPIAPVTLGASVSGSSVRFFVNAAAWADVHYSVGGGVQQDVRMAHDAATNNNDYTLNNVAPGTPLQYYFTYPQRTSVVDTVPSTLTMPGSSSSSSSSGGGTSVTIQERTTGYCGVNGAIASNHAGYTGTGFLDTTNAVGKGADWQVNVNAGSYVLTWRYANDSSNRPGQLRVDGGAVTTVNFPNTGGWTKWKTVSTTVSLSAGSHRLRLQSTGSGGLANIDSLQVTGPNVSPVACGGS